MSRYTRRQVVHGAGAMGLGLLAGCGRPPWQAPPPRLWRIGRMSVVNPHGAWLTSPNATVFTEELRGLGYVEGVNLIWDDAFTDGQLDRLPELAAGLVHQSVDLILIIGGAPAALAARDATSTIPIVFGILGDPVGIGLVASLARPGGNVTGLSSISPQTTGKRLELLRDTLPGLTRVAVLWNAAEPVKALDYQQTEAAAQVLGLTLLSLPVRTRDEFENAFDAAVRERAEALIALGDPLTGGAAPAKRMADLAAERGLPLMLEPRDQALGGALLTYGPDQLAMWRRVAHYIDRILKGAKPADLPVEQPMRFDLVINLKTAQVLGLTIPHYVLLQATEVIQ
jgi:putative tryptophan/tyrosine transport system substrate-binding protein